MLKNDPDLSKPQNLPIKNYFVENHKEKLIWSRIG